MDSSALISGIYYAILNIYTYTLIMRIYKHCQVRVVNHFITAACLAAGSRHVLR